MNYLLDVNALMAWIHPMPAWHHARIHAWRASAPQPQMHTCAITELGFLRITMAQYAIDCAAAKKLLDGGIRHGISGYIDTLPPPRLARWVASHKHTTDAYLCQLAAANGMMLATFDTGIKDAAVFLIP